MIMTRARQTQRSRSKCSNIITVREEKENVSPGLKNIKINIADLEYPRNRHAD